VELVILVLLVMLEPYINSRNLVIHSITSDLAASSRVLNRILIVNHVLGTVLNLG